VDTCRWRSIVSTRNGSVPCSLSTPGLASRTTKRGSVGISALALEYASRFETEGSVIFAEPGNGHEHASLRRRSAPSRSLRRGQGGLSPFSTSSSRELSCHLEMRLVQNSTSVCPFEHRPYTSSGRRRGPVRKLDRDQISQAVVWPFQVVFRCPSFHLLLRFHQRREPVRVQAFIADPRLQAERRGYGVEFFAM